MPGAGRVLKVIQNIATVIETNFLYHVRAIGPGNLLRINWVVEIPSTSKIL